MSTVAIGVGNPLRGDDDVGLRVARAVREQAGPGLRILESAGEPASLLEAWSGAEVAVVVDASHSGGAPGTVRRFDATAAPLPAQTGSSSTHGLGLADAIELGRALGRLPCRLVVYAIEGQAFMTGDSPGPAVTQSVGIVAGRVLAEVSD